MQLNIFIIFFYSFFIGAGEKAAVGKVARWKAECIKARQKKNQTLHDSYILKNDYCILIPSEKDQKIDIFQPLGTEDNACLACIKLLYCEMVRGISNFFTAPSSQSSHKSGKEKI
ncbi:hypothetical protein K9K77_01715 [Candidatus Babeliales bacterium]|nr:hypothetical protein [Candidatus Babeliales bacterium]